MLHDGIQCGYGIRWQRYARINIIPREDVGDAEIFANDLAVVLRSAGYTAEVAGSGLFIDAPKGLKIVYGPHRASEARLIAGAVKSAHIQAVSLQELGQNEADTLTIVVGSKQLE